MLDQFMRGTPDRLRELDQQMVRRLSIMVWTGGIVFFALTTASMVSFFFFE